MRPTFAVLLVVGAACGGGGGGTPDATPSTCERRGDALAWRAVATGLADPVLVTAPTGDPRLWVVERSGRIRLIVDGVVRPTPFLDLADRVVAGGEQGLLGLAFHPGYASNGRLFVYYTAAGGEADVVEEYGVDPGDPDRADPASAATILSVPDLGPTHNGGMIEFGPDGLLYVGIGDGGGANDPGDNGQDVTDLLGKILRIDVDGAAPYAIPSDNPLAGSATPGARGEIWHTGLRNPWRWSIDPATEDMWIGDVGQGAWEEIDRAPAGEGGHNFGWSDREGPDCRNVDPCLAPADAEPAATFTDPVATIVNPPGDVLAAVLGGYVYRGACQQDLVGQYVYGEVFPGAIWTIDATADPLPAPVARTVRRPDGAEAEIVYSFGRDAAGELYVTTYDRGAEAGSVYRLELAE